MSLIYGNDEWSNIAGGDIVEILRGAIGIHTRLDQEVGNLLAVIHRDGGHYVSEHGFFKALKDAESKVTDERAKYDSIKDHICRPTVYLQIDGQFSPFKPGYVIKDVILTGNGNVRLVVEPQVDMKERYTRTDAYSRVKI